MNKIAQDSITTIRTLSIDAVQNANSGHPGAPMGLAPAAYTIWHRHLRHNPANPNWFNRDRFILSNGHASALIYSLLHLTGYNLSIHDLQNFRQWGSITPGHPEVGLTPGIETTTGPLGQGLATAVGFALAEAHLNSKFGNIVDHFTFGICSDGDLMEGVTSEACSLAGHLKLGKLIFLYDDNNITIDGRTDITFSENVLDRFLSYGWHTDSVDNPNDVDAIDAAIIAAKNVTDKPSLISIKAIIGFGSPNKADSSAAHGAPLGRDEVDATKAAYGWNHPPFFVPEDVAEHMNATSDGQKLENEWNKLMLQFKSEKPEQYQELIRRIKNEPHENFDFLPSFQPDTNGLATRKSSGKVLSALMHNCPELIGGSADLAASNNTLNPDLGIISPDDKSGQNIHFGIREHAMAAICNGITLHGACRAFNATFFVFSDYMKPALRIAALSRLPVLSIFTHDSIGLGEDGPTHQPIEQLPMLRAMPNFFVFRPADANETVACWKEAFSRTSGPSALVLTRQNLPTLDLHKLSSIGDPSKGAYVISEPQSPPQAIILATGSEVHLAVQAAETLASSNTFVRVVSMPCLELFEQQKPDYKEKILPHKLTKRLAVEAASPFGWDRYIGFEGDMISMNRFGASAPANTLFREFGFTVENIVDKVKALLG